MIYRDKDVKTLGFAWRHIGGSVNFLLSSDRSLVDSTGRFSADPRLLAALLKRVGLLTFKRSNFTFAGVG